MNLMPGHGWHGCRCWVTQRSAQHLIVVRTYSRGNLGRAVFQGTFLVVASQAAFLEGCSLSSHSRLSIEHAPIELTYLHHTPPASQHQQYMEWMPYRAFHATFAPSFMHFVSLIIMRSLPLLNRALSLLSYSAANR